MAEKQSGEQALALLFDRIAHALRNTTGACVWRSAEYDQEIRMNKSCIFSCPIENIETAERGKILPYKDIEQLHPTLPNNMTPANLLDSLEGTYETLSDAVWQELLDTAAIVVVPKVTSKCGYESGIWAVKPNPDGKSGTLLDVLIKTDDLTIDYIRPVGILDEVQKAMRETIALSADPITKSVGTTRGQAPLVVLTCGRCALLVMAATSESDFLTTVTLPNGSILEGDGYDPETRTFSKFILQRKKAMSTLRSLVKPATKAVEIKPVYKEGEEKPLVNTPAELGELAQPAPTVAIAVAAEAAPADDDDLSLDNVTDVSPEDAQAILAEVEEAKKANEKAAEQPTPEAPAEPAAAEAPAKAAETEAPKRQRAPRTPKPAQFDFDAAIAAVSAPAEGLTPEQVDERIRKLRDLQKACISSMANISLTYIRSSKAAIDRYNQIQQLIK